jgi:catechol 2,3-dioxygenase-like lactoylglutathione lyase family enzyme
MKIRTVYFKVHRVGEALKFWQALLGMEPSKSFPAWHEFSIGDTRLGLLPVDDPGVDSLSGSCVPVFEFSDNHAARTIERAKDLGASVILEGEAHPDYPHTAAVLADPLGNEFEITAFHD